MDAAAVTALRTAGGGCAGDQSSPAPGTETVGVVGCGVNGGETVRMLAAIGRPTLVHDRDAARAGAVASTYGARAVTLEEALAADAVITVTPGKDLLYREGSLPRGTARVADGCRRPWRGRGRHPRSPAHVCCRRLGAGITRRRARGGGRGRARRARAGDRAGSHPHRRGRRSAQRRGRWLAAGPRPALAIQALAMAMAAIYAQADALGVPRF